VVKKRTTPSFTDDEVGDAILRELYERRANARGMSNAKAGIMEIRRALKKKGIGQKQVIKNLLYLIEYGWVSEVVQQGQIKRGSGFFPTTTTKYMITNQGMELFDEESKFSRPQGVAGIRIENESGIVVVGKTNLQNQHLIKVQ